MIAPEMPSETVTFSTSAIDIVPVQEAFSLFTRRSPKTGRPRIQAKPSGIDYAKLIETAHAAELARGVNYAALSGAGQIPGQLGLLTGEEVNPND
jgi:hypothetical protein